MQQLELIICVGRHSPLPEAHEVKVQEWLEFATRRLNASLLSPEQPDVFSEDSAIAETLAKHEWLAGSAFTAADIVVAAFLLSVSDGSGLRSKTETWLKVCHSLPQPFLNICIDNNIVKCGQIHHFN
jgi:glutathione S-transferase